MSNDLPRKVAPVHHMPPPLLISNNPMYLCQGLFPNFIFPPTVFIVTKSPLHGVPDWLLQRQQLVTSPFEILVMQLLVGCLFIPILHVHSASFKFETRWMLCLKHLNGYSYFVRKKEPFKREDRRRWSIPRETTKSVFLDLSQPSVRWDDSYLGHTKGKRSSPW